MFIKTLFLVLLVTLAARADEHFDTLTVNDETFTNVTIIKVTAKDIYFLHSNGMENVQLKDLDPALQKHFGYNAKAATQAAQAVAAAKVQYHQELVSAPPVAVPDTSRPVEPRVVEGLEIGQKFPWFSETDVAGNPVSVAGFKGKVLLIDFWATWCETCKVELPNVIALYQKFHPQGFEVVGVSLDEDRDKLIAFTKQNGMVWQQYFDGLGWDNKLARAYQVELIPMTYLLDRHGIILGKKLRGEELDNAVVSAMANP
jgi:thiol-disulfide isomerase/thioredoxin